MEEKRNITIIGTGTVQNIFTSKLEKITERETFKDIR